MSFPRYESYKDSGVEWLGEVPEHWKTVQFKRLASIQNGRDYKHIETDDCDGYPVIGSGGQFARATEYLFTGESVLLGRKGTIDKPLYINGSFWVVDTMFYTIVNENSFPKYLYYCALTIRFDLYSTSTALPSMTQNDLGSIHFAIPDLAEQTTIATFLDRETAKIDALVAEQQRLIELLKEKRRAVISHAVTKGLNPDAPMKDSGIEWLGEVPEHWYVIQLKRAIVLQRGHDLPADDREEGKVPIVSSGGITGKHRQAKAKGPGIVTGRYGTIGQFIFVEEDYWPLNTTLYSVDMFSNAPRFLWYMLQNISCLFILNSGKAAVPGVDRNDLHPVLIALPLFNEQELIAAFLDCETTKLDALTAEAKTAITLLQERRTALISAAVTGKIDVRGFASDSTH